MKTKTHTYSTRKTGRFFWTKFYVIVDGEEWDLRDCGFGWAYVTTAQAVLVVILGVDGGWIVRR